MRTLTAILALVFLSLSTSATEPSIVVIKLTSVNAALGDLEALGMFEDPQAESEQFLHEIVEPLRLPLGDWLDRNRPAFVLATGPGIMGGQTDAMTAMLPALDVDDALRALGGDPATEPEDGIHEIARHDEGSWFVRGEEHYLTIGMQREQIVGFDRAAVESLDFPTGNMGVDINIEIVTPMIQGLINMQRQRMAQQMEQMGAQPGEPQASEPGMPDPQALVGMMDFYFDTILTVLRNTARFQLSLDTVGGDAILRARVVPMPGSELETLLAEQPVGFAKLSRAIPEGPALVSYSGNLRLTDGVLEGFSQWMDQYVDFMGQMAGFMPEIAWLKDLIGGQQELAKQRLACMRGDMAGSIDMAGDEGFGSIELYGILATEDCQSIAEREVETLQQLLDPDGEPFISVTEPNVAPGDVRAMRVEVDLERLVQDDETAMQLLEGMFGEGGTVTYNGQTEDVTISVTGADAERRFTEVVDRLESRRKRGGLTPEAFEPLAAGAGLFAVVDLSLLDLEELLGLTAPGTEQDEDPETDAAGAAEAEPLTGRMVLGAHALQGNLAIDLALPAEVLRLWAEDDGDDGLPPDLWPPPPAAAVVADESKDDAETASDDEGIQDAGQEDVTLPVIVNKIKPDYPEILREAMLEGSVVLQAVVSKDGTVSDVELIQCDGKSPFEAQPRKHLQHESTFCTLLSDAAIAAVERWRYEPARKGDEPVDVYFTVRVDFELK